MSDHNAHDNGQCNEDDCFQFDGKRCKALGHRPSEFCEVWIDERVEEITRLKAQLDEANERIQELEYQAWEG